MQLPGKELRLMDYGFQSKETRNELKQVKIWRLAQVWDGNVSRLGGTLLQHASFRGDAALDLLHG
jgi:hypothetical protein